MNRCLRVDIASVWQTIHNNEIITKWVKTQQQLADVLTKRGSSSTVLMIVLQNGHHLSQ